METDSTPKITKYGSAEKFGHVGRAHGNLERIAEVFVLRLATTTEHTLTAKEVADTLDMDRAHVGRLINERPGFVRVLGVGQQGKYLAYYYMHEFADLAVRQGANYYPYNTVPMFPTNVPVEIVVAEPPTVDANPVEVKRSGPSVPYHGQTKVLNYLSIPLLDISVEKVLTVASATKELGDFLGAQLSAAIVALQTSQPLDLTGLDQGLVSLANFYQWLKAHRDDPDAALILAEVKASTNG